MSEQLENAWKEFERCGEISNSAEGLLDYASKLKEQNENMCEVISEMINQYDTEEICRDGYDYVLMRHARKILEQVRGE